MAKISSQRDSLSAPESGKFPETRESILAQAFAGELQPFLAAYLRPCWNHVQFLCRQHGLPIVDAEDLFQELLLRVIREGPLSLPKGKEHPRVLVRSAANLPGRYFLAAQLGLKKAKFRTYLKSAIANLLKERWRQKRRSPRSLAEDEDVMDRIVEESALGWDDWAWTQILQDSARAFAVRCARSRTKGRLREFDALYAVLVEGESATSLAQRWQLDRSTVSEILSVARSNFRQILSETAPRADLQDILRFSKRCPRVLVAAFENAKRHNKISNVHRRSDVRT